MSALVVILRELAFDFDVGLFNVIATLRTRIGDGSSDLQIGGRLSAALQAKITRLVEEELASHVDAEPSSSGVPPVYSGEESF